MCCRADTTRYNSITAVISRAEHEILACTRALGVDSENDSVGDQKHFWVPEQKMASNCLDAPLSSLCCLSPHKSDKKTRTLYIAHAGQSPGGGMILHSPTFPATGSTTSSMYRRKLLNSCSVGLNTGHVVSAIPALFLFRFSPECVSRLPSRAPVYAPRASCPFSFSFVLSVL